MARPVNTAPCAFDDCGRPARSRGWCLTHYKQWWKSGGDETAMRPIVSIPAQLGTCTAPECDRPARDLCRVHQQQLWRRGGDRALLTPLGQESRAACAGPACDRVAVRGRDLCQAHGGQLTSRGDMALLTPLRVHRPAGQPATCAGPECARTATSRGLCQTHYKQLRLRDWDMARLTKIGPTSQSLKGKGKKDVAKAEAAARREARAAAKPKPKPTPSNLPAGWFTPTIKPKPKRTPKPPTNPSDIMVYYTPPTPAQTAAALRVLAAHDALDLADILGIAA